MRPGGWIAALASGLIVAACALAPVYARHVPGTDPFRSNPTGTVAASRCWPRTRAWA